MKKILLAIAFILVAGLSFGCARGGMLPDKQGDQIYKVYITGTDRRWEEYYDVVSYRYMGEEVVLTFKDGMQMIVHSINVKIVLKGE